MSKAENEPWWPMLTIKHGRSKGIWTLVLIAAVMSPVPAFAQAVDNEEGFSEIAENAIVGQLESGSECDVFGDNGLCVFGSVAASPSDESSSLTGAAGLAYQLEDDATVGATIAVGRASFEGEDDAGWLTGTGFVSIGSDEEGLSGFVSASVGRVELDGEDDAIGAALYGALSWTAEVSEGISVSPFTRLTLVHAFDDAGLDDDEEIGAEGQVGVAAELEVTDEMEIELSAAVGRDLVQEDAALEFETEAGVELEIAENASIGIDAELEFSQEESNPELTVTTGFKVGF